MLCCKCNYLLDVLIIHYIIHKYMLLVAFIYIINFLLIYVYHILFFKNYLAFTYVQCKLPA